MKKILAVVMGMIMLMSLAVLPGCNLARAKPISLASCETVVLGKYHDIDLEWIVLRTNEQGEKLLLSKYVIDARLYNEIEPGDPGRDNQSWDTSTLRGWLNTDFIENSFDEFEKKGIIQSYEANGNNKKYHTKGGDNTYDNVFILSIDEAKAYFASDEDRKAKPLEDPASYDELWVDEDGYCSWWLRSPGCEAGYGANVRSNGFVYLRGDDRNIFRLGVRPAMWVSFGRIDSAIMNESLHAKYEKEQSERIAAERTVEVDLNLIRFVNGQTAYFGNYGGEKLVWRILDKQDDKVLLVTESIVFSTAYDFTEKDTTWEKCSLRNWLNNSFLNDAFSQEERKMILMTEITNSGNKDKKVPGGNNTEDKVFLLSLDEAETYFHGDSSRQTAAYSYAKKGNVLYVDENGYSLWWLRTPGATGSAACYVDHLGRIQTGGMMNRFDYIGVRPAIWVALKENK